MHDQYIEAAFILQKLRDTAPLAESISYLDLHRYFRGTGFSEAALPWRVWFDQSARDTQPAFYAYQFLARLGPNDIFTSDEAHS